MNRSFSRSTLLAATFLVAGMFLGSPATQVQADDINTNNLPPLPDIRTPDQVRWFERWRNRRVIQKEIRHAKAEARREARERQSRATVNRPAQDPSTAAAVVSSQSGAPYAGSNTAPETIDGAALKPFNSGSKFYQGGFLVFQSKDGRRR
ncbi:MAG: hypothetical protein ACPGFB_12830 [Verrucomicrobiales bacterium]